jgi:hypothetical protein
MLDKSECPALKKPLIEGLFLNSVRFNLPHHQLGHHPDLHIQVGQHVVYHFFQRYVLNYVLANLYMQIRMMA